jgi:hypothetical protein
MGTIQQIIDRAASDSEFMKKLVQDPAGAVQGEGYSLDLDELRSLLDMPGADYPAVEEALQQRLQHSGSSPSLRSIIPNNGAN